MTSSKRLISVFQTQADALRSGVQLAKMNEY